MGHLVCSNHGFSKPCSGPASVEQTGCLQLLFQGRSTYLSKKNQRAQAKRRLDVLTRRSGGVARSGSPFSMLNRLLACLLALLSLAAQAQTAAGRVVSQTTGAPVPDATVRL